MVEPLDTELAACCVVRATVFSLQLIWMVQSTGKSALLHATVAVAFGKKPARVCDQSYKSLAATLMAELQGAELPVVQ